MVQTSATKDITVQDQGGFLTVLKNNENTMRDIEAFKQAPISRKAQTMIFTGITVGGLILASVLAMQIITGALALAVMGIVLVGGFMGIRALRAADPLIQQKTKNYILKKMYEEARINAVSQLDNQVLVNHQKLIDARKSRDKMGALVEDLKTKISSLAPASGNLVKMQGILARVEAAYTIICNNVDKAQLVNADFEIKVKDYKDLDSFSKLAGEALSIFDGSDKMAEMLSLESFKHIDSEFNIALVSIENSARDMELENR